MQPHMVRQQTALLHKKASFYPYCEYSLYDKMNKSHYGVMGMGFTTLVHDFQAKPYSLSKHSSGTWFLSS